MLPVQFFGQNLHFAVSLFAALVFFAIFWLYLDAWTNKKEKKELFKWSGSLLVSLSFLVHATFIEQSVLGESVFGETSEILTTFLRLLGYAGLIIGLVIDPLQKEPNVGQILGSSRPVPSVAAGGKLAGLSFALPVGAAIVGILYLRRATKGLERHLRQVAIAFFLLAAYEATALAALLRDSNNPNVVNMVKPFGTIWVVEHLLLLASAIVLGLWVWHYLIKRFISQLFMIFVTATLIIFLVTTVGFTFLLMRSIQNSALDNLETASNVLSYAINSKKAETRANAETVAQNPLLATAVKNKKHEQLVSLTADFLAKRKQSSLVITDASARVLLRAEDPDRFGDSISSDTLVRRALIGEEASSVSTSEGVLSPMVHIRSSVPIRDNANAILGSVTIGLLTDNALVDGIKQSTGLDSAIYGGNQRAATTFVAPDGKSRWVGVKENNRIVSKQVLGSGDVFKGELSVLNRPFLAVYTPLKDVDNSVVGMLFIGEPQVNILKTAGRSIEITFVAAATLMALAIVPAYLIARHLSKQLE